MKEVKAACRRQICRSAANKRVHKRRQAFFESASVSAAALIVVGCGILGLWVTSTNSIRDNYHDYLLGLAQTASRLVDPGLHNSIRQPEQRNGPDYTRAVDPLRRMRAALSDVHYIYTVVQDGTEVRFVLDAAEPGKLGPDGIDDQSGVWEVYDERDPAMLQALNNGQAAVTDRPYSDKWGTFMTSWAPLKDESGRQIGAVGVDVDASVYVARLASARHWALFGLAPAGLLIAILGAAFYRIRLRGLTDAEAAKLAADVLAVERQRLKAVIEGTNVGTWEWDIKRGVTTISDGLAGMLGYGHEQLSTLTDDQWQAHIHPEDLPATEQAMAVCLATPEMVFVHEFRMRHREEHWVWILARGKVMDRDIENQPLRMAGIHVDVSARKLAELTLLESENKFRSLFELSPVGIALNDLHSGQFLQVNEALVGPTGYTREELLQMSYWDITPASFTAQETTQIASLAQSNQYGPYEKEYQRKDGSTYPVLVSGIRLRDASGRPVVWSIVQDISHRKAMESELAAAAWQDKLTGLANRALFMDRLQKSVDRVRHGRQSLFAVLFLDFDRFKLINDTLGHDAGDELLRQIAMRLQGALRAADNSTDESNLVGRFGGDEFLVLINDLKCTADASRIADRLLAALAPVYSIFGVEVHSTASLGIVTSEQGQASAEEVVRNADVAMYEAKRSGRACSVVFNEAMRTRLTRHVAIETNLRRAIGTPEISLVYQPIVDLKSGRMVSAEALCRWTHPMLGPITPSEFIPIAEDSGLIVALGEWVLDEACQALANWRKLDPQRAPQTVSVNISRAELALGNQLLDQVCATLKRCGLPASCLQLEVTEREVMRNPKASHDLLHALQCLGVHLAMDDFGTGTSSLAFLRDYPFDTIKIDRSFIKDLTAGQDVLAVIKATVNLVDNLGMASLAEGVEEPEQLATLKSLGCRYAQGYLFSIPVAAAQLLDAGSRAEHPHAAVDSETRREVIRRTAGS
jgi:diguanylate cyclase (GGDEF)-like protein/PAS domain S-box-containing protein